MSVIAHSIRPACGREGEAASRSQTDRRDALAGGRYGLYVMQPDGDAVQDISWRGLQAPVEAYIMKEFEGGRHRVPGRSCRLSTQFFAKRAFVRTRFH